MDIALNSLQEDYWETFKLHEEDVKFLYNHLLAGEIPLTSHELVKVLVEDRIKREKRAIELRHSGGGEVYVPKGKYKIGQDLIFPSIGWRRGAVAEKRVGLNPDMPPFEVIKVKFDEGEPREFATALKDHRLNNPLEDIDDDMRLNLMAVINTHEQTLIGELAEGLINNDEFVRIAGRWFPRSLLVDVNAGQLNLAEALLDMESGGSVPTSKLLQTVDMPKDVNENLVAFSLDFALWQDERFDEVGPAGQILWYLKRLEPEEVHELPKFLRYKPVDYNQDVLTSEMLALEYELDDELSPLDSRPEEVDGVEIRLIFPHWRVGSLPLSSRLRNLFPTAYKAPRIRFVLVDGDTGEKFPGWVVREEKYVYGLREFYERKGLIPGSLLLVRRGQNPGEVVVYASGKRPTREWVRTVLVGADGGLVLAMLKQIVKSEFDDRMAIVVSELGVLDDVWTKTEKDRKPFEQIIVDALRELAKLTPQGHVHASELYASVNLTQRCPPGPILALLASRPWFVHVGDLHFRFDDSDGS